MTRHHQIIISGKTEHSAYRLHAYMGAQKMNIRGEVSRQANKVIIEAEGEEAALAEFELWCQETPADCLIDSFSVIEKEPAGYEDFRIL